MFQLACLIVAVASFLVVGFVPAWREPAAALLVGVTFASIYVAVVRRPRALAVAFVASLCFAPFLFLFAPVPILLFGAPLAWHVAGRLLGRGQAHDGPPDADALRRAARRVDDRAEPFNPFGV